MKTPTTPIEIALKDAGLDQRKSNLLRTIFKCIEGSPLWFSQLFTIEPTTKKAIRELLDRYASYAAGHNFGGTSTAGFMDVSERRQLPENFSSLAKALGYNGNDIRGAWLYIHSFIEKHVKFHELSELSDYSAFVLRSNVTTRIDFLLRSNKIKKEDRNKVLELLERLITELGGRLDGYSSSDSYENKIRSLMNRLGNRIFSQSRRKKFGDKVRDILNELEGFLNHETI